MNFKKNKIILIIVLVVLIILLALLMIFKNKGKEEEIEEPVVIRIQEDSASINGIVLALEGEITEDEEKEDTTIFKTEDQEVIITLGEEMAIVNGKEKALRTSTVVEPTTEEQEEEPAQTSEEETLTEVETEEEQPTEEIEKEEVKPGAYVDKEEIFVPIDFIEEVFDVEFDKENEEFIKDGESLAPVEEEEAPIIEVEEPEATEEEDETTDADVVEDEQEEKVEEKEPEVSNETTNTESTTTTPSTNPSTSNSSSNSASTGGSTSTGSSSNNTAPTPAPAPAPTPAPAPEPVQPVEVAVTGVSLNKGNTTLEIGNTMSVSATVAPSNATNKSITWSSSNNGVATVDGNGNIKAVAAGTATITAKANNGVSASLTVTVNKKPDPVYTASSVMNSLITVNGWYKSPQGNPYVGDWEGMSYADGAIYMTNERGYDGIDANLFIRYKNFPNIWEHATTALTYFTDSASAAKLVSYAKNNQFGTYNFSGRSFEIFTTGSCTIISISPKY